MSEAVDNETAVRLALPPGWVKFDTAEQAQAHIDEQRASGADADWQVLQWSGSGEFIAFDMSRKETWNDLSWWAVPASGPVVVRSEFHGYASDESAYRA